MSEAIVPAKHRSPFEGCAPFTQADSGGQVGVQLFAETLPSVTQVSTWISGFAVLEQALVGVLGQKPPAQTGLTLRTAQGHLALPAKM